MRPLVLVHGRSQQNKDPVALKQEWVKSWEKGLQAAGLASPVEREEDVRFVYYGQALHDLLKDVPADEAAKVITQGDLSDAEELSAIHEMLTEIAAAALTAEQLIETGRAPVMEQGVLNWGPIQAILKMIDKHVPFGGSASIALFTQDVYAYTRNPKFRKPVEDALVAELNARRDAVLVSHSLGTLVAYNVLKNASAAAGWSIPLFVTLGSPLAISYLRTWLSPTKRPAGVGEWLNARDPHDVVALYPLSAPHFQVPGLQIENKNDVDNLTSNQHGISGYLSDPVVARKIYEAVTAA